MKKHILLCIALVHGTINCMDVLKEQYPAFIAEQIKKQMFVIHKDWNVLLGSKLNDEISKFIKLGIDINMLIDTAKNTLLHFIADGNHNYLPTEEILNDPQLEVNTQNELGNTPLHCTVFDKKRYCRQTTIEKRLSIAKILIKRDDIDPNITNNQGKTPLLSALECKREDLVALFLSNKKTDLSIAGKDGKAPLHYSAIYEYADLNKITISNPNVQDMYGNSPLHFVKTAKAMKFLLALPGIKVSITNNYGRTPLDYAQEQNFPEKEAVIALLQEAILRESSPEKPQEIVGTPTSLENSPQNNPQSFFEKHRKAILTGSFIGILGLISAIIFAHLHYNTHSLTQ